ncbi:plastocyanin/azurin family copper-binding protein [Halosolutus amylolyticus]|uniref:Plastocyanin/azurin family copper-binding protein n=1 Tax=Halosolutus amylolyticus TaxID=2932267 RepID=A0ABD5PQV6_9EURY|nr:plastocyanin/azurin family copper-binding protein [Halosolutus amylolyticus]
MSDQSSRRRVLGVASGTIVGGLAGCLTDNDGPETDTSQDGSTDGSSDESDDRSGEEDTQSGEESDHESTSASGSEVTMVTNDSGTHFEPHVVRIEPGETVSWVLERGSHTTTAYAPTNDRPRRIPDDADAWDSGTLTEAGATFEHTFETAGVYDYFCSPHENGGMLGSVVVGDPHLDDQPGMAAPQSELPDGSHEKIRGLNEQVRNGGESGHGDHEDDH